MSPEERQAAKDLATVERKIKQLRRVLELRARETELQAECDALQLQVTQEEMRPVSDLGAQDLEIVGLDARLEAAKQRKRDLEASGK